MRTALPGRYRISAKAFRCVRAFCFARCKGVRHTVGTVTARIEEGFAPTSAFQAGRSYTCVSDDADRHASNLHGWSQLYDQLSSGSFQGAIQGAFLGSLHVFRETTSARLRQSCTVRSDAWWFGIPASDDSQFRLDARPMGDGSVAVRRGHSPFELLTPDGFEIFGVVVERWKLLPYLLSQGIGEALPSHCDMLRVNPSTLRRLRLLLRDVIVEVEHRPALMQNEAACQAMENSMLEALASACEDRELVESPGKTALQRTRLVREVREHLLQQEQRVVSIPELCERFAVSRRILQYAFEEVLGIGPNAYIRMLRLNGVRRDLSRLGGGGMSVQQVAADWGFWHLSQFAKDYRQHFHELPSTTLKRGREA